MEAFEPPYLFRGIRPRINAVSTTDLVAGQGFALDVSFTDSVTEVALIGLRATTHWIDGGTNRYLPLDFQQYGSEVYATVPADQIQALSGWYMLFVMVDDIPSEAWIVRVTDTGASPEPGRGTPHVGQPRHPAQYHVHVDDHPHPELESAAATDDSAAAVIQALTRAVSPPTAVAFPDGPARQPSTILDQRPPSQDRPSGPTVSPGDNNVRRGTSSSSPLTAEACCATAVVMVFEDVDLS